jgi:hypothetical protein
MLSNLYWVIVAAVIFAVFYLLAVRLNKMKPALIVALVMAVISHFFYYYYLEQMLVKRWGGSMSVQVPEGQHHIGVTWKDDHLWIQNYDPASNECIFREYSRGSVLEGEVRLRNCNPLQLLGVEQLEKLINSSSRPMPAPAGSAAEASQ